eukprot:5668311-Ditylum_brightwellii.AAC.1
MSETSTAHLNKAILQVQSFNIEDHDKCISGGRMEGQKEKGEKYEQVSSDTATHISPDVVQAIRQGQKCGQWLNILPTY